MRPISFLTLSCTLVLTLSAALADERPEHFEGEPSPTVEAAFANLSVYNAKLAALVEKGTLNPQDMHQVHQLTYTLENALEKLREEHAQIAELLEEVHIASETADPDTVTGSGREYLERSEKLIP